MIIWGSGGKDADLGVAEHRACTTCEKERPFKVLLNYRYAHLYYLRWVTRKNYFLACEVCQRGWPLDAKAVEARQKEHPIPFMTRYGWTFLVGILALFCLTALLTSLRAVAQVKAQAPETKPAMLHATGPMTPLKAAFEQARVAQNIDLVLPALRAAELYLVVKPDPADPDKQVPYLVKSPKEGRMSVTVSESLDSMQKISAPKRKVTGAQLLAELQPGEEIVIMYPDGGDYVTREQLEWFKQLPAR